MKKYLWFLIFLLMTTSASADTKISAMTSDTSPVKENLIPEVITPSGTPANRNMTIQNMFKAADMTIDGTNVGIGSVTPRGRLDLGSGAIYGDGSNLTGIAAGGSGWTDAGTAVYLTTLTDNVGIGTSTPGVRLDIQGAGSLSLKILNTTTSSSAQGAGIMMYSDDGAAMASGDRLGSIGFGGAYDSAHTLYSAAFIQSNATENWTGGSFTLGSNLTFYTNLNGSNTRAERLRIENNGNVGIGSTAPAQALDVTGSIRSSTVSGQADGILLCVKSGRVGYCSGSVTSVSCTCN